MKKSIKKIIAMGMMAVLISSNAIAVSAQTKSGRVNGINFNAFSNFSRTNNQVEAALDYFENVFR